MDINGTIIRNRRLVSDSENIKEDILEIKNRNEHVRIRILN